ncbi:MAG: RodZ domain-containing protein [Pseudomonadota bacterium]
METVGQYLKEEREKRGLSIEEINQRTRISLHVIEVLERGQTALLPPPVILRGFLKNYAKALDLDPTEVLTRYHQEVGATPQKTLRMLQSVPEARRPGLLLVGIIAAGVLVLLLLLLLPRGNQTPAPLVESPAPAPVPAPTATLPAPMPPVGPMSPAQETLMPLQDSPGPAAAGPTPLGMPSFPAAPAQATTATPTPAADSTTAPSAGQMPKQPQTVKPNKQPVTNPPERAKPKPKPAEAPTTNPSSIGEAKSPNSPPPAPKRHVLGVSASRPTWLRVNRDGSLIKEYLLREGERLSLEAADRFHILVGNAGGVDLRLDGKPVGALGQLGEVVSLTLPKKSTSPALRYQRPRVVSSPTL